METPFFFDRRGEINRETLSDAGYAPIDAGQVSIELGSPMPRPRTAPATPPAAAPAAANSIITNELLSMKIDLILQGLQSQAATSAGIVSPGRSISTPSASRPLALPAHLDSTTD